jgi:ferric-dicitrate binding protein FerR (iron transport regulator)
MEKRNLWILLGKQLSGEITAKEKVALQKLIGDEEQDMSYLIEFMEEHWRKGSQSGNNEDPAVNEQWERLREQLFRHQQKGREDDLSFSRARRPSGLWYKIAACLVVLVAAYYFLQQRTSHPPGSRHEIVVENGAKKHVTLPDGTSVWLNAGSTLSYNSGFGEGNRDVWLEGEGYFKVMDDASAPFRVRTHDVTIKVLGTTFNVKAYTDDPDIQTTLISGKVQVLLNDDPEKRILLSPREKLTVMSDKHTMVKTSLASRQKATRKLPVIPRANALKYQVQVLPLNPVDSTFFTETAWVDNQLAFVYQPFEDVAKKMERRYNVHIFFRDTSLKKVVMSGIFDKENISQALQVLQLITRFDYKIEGDSIYLYK